MDPVVAPAAPSGSDGITLPTAPVTPAAEGTITAREAGRILANARVAKRQAEQSPSSEPDKAAAPVNESPAAQAEGDAAPVIEQEPGETTDAPDPAELPTIEPPRSWTKEAKERWASLPRDTQEYLSGREQEREREFRRSQNDAAEKLKGLTAKEQAVEQERQRYESMLPQILELVQQQGATEFSDIKTMADLQRVAAEDPAKYIRWQAHQQQVQATANELNAANERTAKQHSERWDEFSKREDAAIAERIPDLANPDKAKKLVDTAASVLRDVGFSDQELSESYNGHLGISLRDHRMQLILHDAMKYREAKIKAATPTPKPVPLVQRPGVAQPAGAAAQSNIQALSAKLDQSGSAKDAAAVIAARRAANGRR